MTERPVFPADVDVAVVSHNGRATLPRVLAGLEAAGLPADRVSLYDIASTDGTIAWMASAYPAARLVRLDANAGPNPARNRALAEATRPYLLLVDSDAYLDAAAPTALRAAVGTDESIGAAVPVVVHDTRPDVIQYASSRLHFVCEAINPFSEQPVAARGTDVRDIGTAPGVAFLLNVARARAIGSFDERYFMGKEDGEFCYRLRLSGARLVETPGAIARHGTKPRTTWLYSYQVRNRWHFMLKNFELRTLVVIAPALAVHEVLQLGVLAVQGQMGAWWRGFTGLGALAGSLAADRRSVAALRRVSDRALLDAAPLMVRADVVGGTGGRTLKRLYDAWLGLYWSLAKRALR